MARALPWYPQLTRPWRTTFAKSKLAPENGDPAVPTSSLSSRWDVLSFPILSLYQLGHGERCKRSMKDPMDSVRCAQLHWFSGRHLPLSPAPYRYASLDQRFRIYSCCAWSQGHNPKHQTHENEPLLRCTDHPAWKDCRRSPWVYVPWLQDDCRWKLRVRD